MTAMTLRVGQLECRLVLNAGRGELRRFSLDRDVTRVGRSADCEAQVDHAFISRHHFQLIRREGRFLLEDTRSAGGTYVNGRKIATAELRVGDSVHLGSNLLFHFEHRGGAATDEELHPQLRAICDDPSDDRARLAFADWLADRNDPRGELIRCQIHADRLPELDPRRAELETRAQLLLDRHARTWVQPLPLFVESWRFRRGFLSELRLDARAVLDDAFPVLRRAHPIQSLDFLLGTLTPELRAQLLASSRLDGLTW